MIPLHISLTVSISNTPRQDPLDINSIFFSGELLDAADHLNTWGRRNARGTKARTRQILDLRLVVNLFCGRSCVPPVLHPRQKQDEAADAAQRPETSDSTYSVLQRRRTSFGECTGKEQLSSHNQKKKSSFALKSIPAGKRGNSAGDASAAMMRPIRCCCGKVMLHCIPRSGHF